MHIRKIIYLLNLSCISYNFESANNHTVRKPYDTRTQQPVRHSAYCWSRQFPPFSAPSIPVALVLIFSPVPSRSPPNEDKQSFIPLFTHRYFGFYIAAQPHLLLLLSCILCRLLTLWNSSGDSVWRGKCYIQDCKTNLRSVPLFKSFTIVIKWVITSPLRFIQYMGVWD